MCEQLGIPALTGKRGEMMIIKPLKNIFYSAAMHLILKILSTNNNDFKVTLMKSLLINRDYPTLNKNNQFLSLELFDN